MGVVAGTSFFAGAVLGLRFKVSVLVPAMLVASVVVSITAIDSRVGLWLLALMVIVAVTSMQVGYLLGAAASPLFEVTTKQDAGVASRSSDAVEGPVRSRR
jgi:hypothetical protein